MTLPWCLIFGEPWPSWPSGLMGLFSSARWVQCWRRELRRAMPAWNENLSTWPSSSFNRAPQHYQDQMLLDASNISISCFIWLSGKSARSCFDPWSMIHEAIEHNGTSSSFSRWTFPQTNSSIVVFSTHQWLCPVGSRFMFWNGWHGWIPLLLR